MGGCFSGPRDPPTLSGDPSESQNLPAIGRNQPLRAEKPKWKNEFPLTNGQLQSKRDEFWDTAPAFDGRKEIWDALRAAAQAFENGDQALAQAFIDGANISLPNGTLMDCYDELGNRYILPIFCIVPPVNLVEEKNSETDCGDLDSSSAKRGIECQLRLRLSTGKEIRLTVQSTDTVYMAKKRLLLSEAVEVNRQRWYFSGKLMNDKMLIEDAKIQKGYLVQVIVSSDSVNESKSAEARL